MFWVSKGKQQVSKRKQSLRDCTSPACPTDSTPRWLIPGNCLFLGVTFLKGSTTRLIPGNYPVSGRTRMMTVFLNVCLSQRRSERSDGSGLGCINLTLGDRFGDASPQRFQQLRVPLTGSGTCFLSYAGSDVANCSSRSKDLKAHRKAHNRASGQRGHHPSTYSGLIGNQSHADGIGRRALMPSAKRHAAFH